MAIKKSGKGALTLGLTSLQAKELCKDLNLVRSGSHLLYLDGRKQPHGPLCTKEIKGVKTLVDIRHTLWEIENGPKPKGVPLLGCPDNPCCIEPEHQSLRQTEDPKERFMRFVEKCPGDDGCWLWRGYTDEGSRRRGLPYGYFWLKGQRNTPAHRFAYETFVGPIPRGMYVDHICHRTLCVKPDHLRLVSKTGNSQNRVPTSKRSSFGLRNITISKKQRGYASDGVYIRVKVYASGENHYSTHRYLLPELPHAEQIACYMRHKYQPDSDDNEFAAAVALQKAEDEPVLEVLRQSLKAMHDLYASPMVRTTPTAAECERLLVRYRKEPLSLMRRGPMEPINDFHLERDPLCLHYEVPSDETVEARFRRLAAKTAGPRGCWIWQGASHYEKGRLRGSLQVRRGVVRPVVLYAYELFKGSVPRYWFIGHTCGQALCVNPHHLFLTKVPRDLWKKS